MLISSQLGVGLKEAAVKTAEKFVKLGERTESIYARVERSTRMTACP
jgi:hypothetical protein